MLKETALVLKTIKERLKIIVNHKITDNCRNKWLNYQFTQTKTHPYKNQHPMQQIQMIKDTHNQS